MSRRTFQATVCRFCRKVKIGHTWVMERREYDVKRLVSVCPDCASALQRKPANLDTRIIQQPGVNPHDHA